MEGGGGGKERSVGGVAALASGGCLVDVDHLVVGQSFGMNCMVSAAPAAAIGDGNGDHPLPYLYPSFSFSLLPSALYVHERAVPGNVIGLSSAEGRQEQQQQQQQKPRQFVSISGIRKCALDLMGTGRGSV